MIRALTGREVPADGRSADIGVLVHNVATAFAVRDAVRFPHRDGIPYDLGHAETIKDRMVTLFFVDGIDMDSIR